VKRGLLWLGCVLLFVVMASSSASAQTEADTRDLIDQIKKPVEWFEWGVDLRIRQVYMENAIDLLDSVDDNRHFFRVRTGVWARIGPFLKDDDLKAPNGVSLYVRGVNEWYTYAQRSNLGRNVPAGTINGLRNGINEFVLESAYVDLVRFIHVGGLPVSVRVGRQDIAYGKGWVILDGTPLDGARTTYSDAIKATLHLDVDSTVDVFYIDNNAYQSRVEPLNPEGYPLNRTSEYDARVAGIYGMTKLYANEDFSADADMYYIYKDEDLRDARAGIVAPYRGGRIVHTYGGAFNGRFLKDGDYYAEGAFQWGKEGNLDRRGLGFNSDLGYTLTGVVWQPRVHGAFEYLSGDEPETTKVEAWDPVLSRWPQWSELYAYRWALEGGMPGAYTNLQRYTLGTSVNPTEKMKVSADYSYVRANEHTFGRAVVLPALPMGDGASRGQHLLAVLEYAFNDYISGHLWAEYFHPESFYDDSTDDALFLRWQLVFKF